jgi:ABC-type uncharacterized transport system substrate-binding protein
MCRRLLAATIALCLGVPAAASAHPHVFVDYSVEYRVKDQSIVGLRLLWRFDDQYSSLVIATVDADHDDKLSPAEIARLAKRVVPSLEKNHFYSDVTVDGTKWLPRHVGDFSARIDDDRIVYSFTVDLPRPAHSVTVSTYDAEYYIEMLAIRKHAYSVVGAPPDALHCSLGFGPKVTTEFYGSFQPDAVTCTVAGGQ